LPVAALFLAGVDRVLLAEAERVDAVVRLAAVFWRAAAAFVRALPDFVRDAAVFVREAVLFERVAAVFVRAVLGFARAVAVFDRVAAPFLAEAERAALGRLAAALPPSRPPLRADTLVSFTPRPEPDLLPPPDSLLTVAQARRSASFSETPRSS
jgi:hypothetical protein